MLVLLVSGLFYLNAFADEIEVDFSPSEEKKKTIADQETLYIDGELSEKKSAKVPDGAPGDEEEKFLGNELGRMKGMSKGYERKNKIIEKMTEVSEVLKENHLQYVEGRADYEEAISEYNQQVECVKQKGVRECSGKKKKGEKKRDEPINVERYVDRVRDAIAVRHRELQGCYESHGNYLTGRMETNLEINGSGTLVHVGFPTLDQGKAKGLANCFTSVLSEIKYPETNDGNSVRVLMPFRLKLKGEEMASGEFGEDSLM